MKLLTPLILAAAMMTARAWSSEVILEDNFADGDRTNLQPKDSASWFVSQHINAIKIVGGKLRWFPKNQHQTVVAYFQDLDSPRALDIGETLTASFDILFPKQPEQAIAGLRAGLLVSGGQRVESDEFNVKFPGEHGGIFFAADVGPDAAISRILVRSSGAGNAMVGDLHKLDVFRFVKGGLPAGVLEGSVAYTCRLSVKRKTDTLVEFSYGIFDGDARIYGASADVPVNDFVSGRDGSLVFDTLALGRVGGELGFSEALISNLSVNIEGQP